MPTLSAAVTGGPGEGYMLLLFTLPAFPATFPVRLRRSVKLPLPLLCAARTDTLFSQESVSLPSARVGTPPVRCHSI